MKLYQYVYSDSSRRVRIFLAEKGIEIPLESVDITRGESHTPGFTAKNPMGQVPVLELDDGAYLAESIAICRYFEEMHPQPPLFGRNARERAEIEMWSRRVELGLTQPVKRLFRLRYIPAGSVSTATLDDIAAMERREAQAACQFLDETLAQREYIAGSTYSIADIMALCTYDMAVSQMRIPLDVDLSSLSRWHDTVLSRPSARA